MSLTELTARRRPSATLQQSLSHRLKVPSKGQPDHGDAKVDLSDRFNVLKTSEFLDKHPEMRLIPFEDSFSVNGHFEFRSIHKNVEVNETYSLRIDFPADLNFELPSVFETGGRIPNDFHKLSNGSLCLGSPLRLRILVGRSFSLSTFVELCVVPYLHGFTIFEETGNLPFGELRHGVDGIIDDFIDIFEVESSDGLDARVKAFKLFELAARPRSKANRVECPCGSGLRVGKCHHKIWNELRKKVGRL